MVTMIDANVSGIVFNVQKFSVHDGQGIRTLVFLKGCPLRCNGAATPNPSAFSRKWPSTRPAV